MPLFVVSLLTLCKLQLLNNLTFINKQMNKYISIQGKNFTSKRFDFRLRRLSTNNKGATNL